MSNVECRRKQECSNDEVIAASTFLRHSSLVLRHYFMKLIAISAPDFDLEKTLDSGQVFHWEKIGNGFVGTIGDLAVYVAQYGNTLKACSAKLDGLKPSS